MTFPAKQKDYQKDGTTAERETARANAREWGARNLKRHYEKQGRDVSHEQCRREFNARADGVDAKRDRGN